jgi:hypothetical protein
MKHRRSADRSERLNPYTPGPPQARQKLSVARIRHEKARVTCKTCGLEKCIGKCMWQVVGAYSE